MKKIMAVLLCAVMLSGIAGCGNAVNPNAVYIFAEYNGTAGAEDASVKAAIEAKFKADTGLEIDLQVETAGTDFIGQKIIAAVGDASSRIDAIVNHYGADSPIHSYITDGLAVDLTSLVNEHAPNYVNKFTDETDPGGLAASSGVYKGKLQALSEVSRSSQWGMMIRRDYMALTDFNPDEYDITKEGYKSLSVDDFKSLLLQLRDKTDCVRPIVARPWDLEEIIAPVYGAVSYNNYVLDGEGNLIQSYADEPYCKVMEFFRWLQEEKLWIEAPGSAQNLRSYFISGKGAVHLEWPEVVSQIEVARLMEEAGGECVFVAPLLKDGSDSESNGNLKVSAAFSGLAVIQKSQNTELLLKYINWLFAGVENYELAKYGIEGTHWVKKTAEDGTPLWDYPDAKRSQYERNKPYSGKYCILSDYTVSDRLYAQFTEAEMEVINTVRGFGYYPSSYATEGMILPKIPSTDRTLKLAETAFYDEYTTLRAYSWSDAGIPGGKTIAQLWQSLRDKLYGDAKALMEFNTQNYYEIINNR